ncbi:MAG TPA: sigma-70 family RNA polymerase sigma factor [Solirubrobacteraceae bacterium]|jgi:RNA polymerase sigma factor (sigma-70 family)
MSPSVSARLLLTQSDARLVAFARAGHERAFEALVRRYRGPLLGYCRRLLLSEERAEDALQQALTQAWLALRADTDVQNAKAWLYRIVHNSALNALRVSGYDYCTLSESLTGAGAPQEDLDRRIAVREVLAGLAALPEMQREALLRTAVEGSSHRETARELGVSEPALRGLVYRARATLRATAGAFVPGPVVSWALSSGSGAPAGERVAEVGLGAGGAGVTGLLMKGGAMAVTAGVLAGSIAAVHAHQVPVKRQGTPAGVHRQTQMGTRRIALANVGIRNWRPSAHVTRAYVAQSTPVPAHRPLHEPAVARGRRRRDYERSPGFLTSASALVTVKPSSTGGDHASSRDGGGGAHDGPGSPGSPGSPSTGGRAGADHRGDVSGGEGGGARGGDHESRGDGSGDREGGAPGGSAMSGPSEGDLSGDHGGGRDGQSEPAAVRGESGTSQPSVSTRATGADGARGR